MKDRADQIQVTPVAIANPIVPDYATLGQPQAPAGPAPRKQRKTIDGTIRVFLAEALIVPTGLVTAIYLTNHLGKTGYGLFTLVATLIAWIEWSITSIFTRATIKFISEAKDDWKGVGTVVVWAHLALSIAAMAVLMILADPIADFMDLEAMQNDIRLFALDLPLFSLAQAHRHILIGKGDFRHRALTSVGRWVTRMILMVGLVHLGYGVNGAILGALGASVVELIVARYHARAPFFSRASNFPLAKLFGYAVPLFLAAMSLRLYEKLDVFLLRPLGQAAGEVGVYGAAQNIALIPGIFAMSFSPLLLSTLIRTLKHGSVKRSKEMARDAMRFTVMMLIGAAIMAGAGPEIVKLVFKPEFSHAGTLLGVLIIGTTSAVMISVGTSILIAAGRPTWTVALCAPLVPLAAMGHVLIIPHHQSLGAASVTCATAFIGAVGAVLAVYKIWKIYPPFGTIARTVIVAIAAGMIAHHLKTNGIWLLVKIPTIGLCALAAMALLGEFSAKERATAWSLLGYHPAVPEPAPKSA